MDPHLRASDADRQQVIDALTAHTAAGRLTLDEFTARVDAVTRARTYGELADVTADLPDAARTRPAGRASAVPALALSAVLLAVLVGALLVAGVGWGQMSTMMASMSTAMGCG
jgi:Domain of unknown function (DUF1707)